MMIGFDRLIMDAHLMDGEYDQACDVWQEALKAQTAGDISENVAEGADILIDHAVTFKKHSLAYRVMDVQNAHLPYGNPDHAERIAETGLLVMNSMLNPYWGKDETAVKTWEKTVGYLSVREKNVRDHFVEKAGNLLIDHLVGQDKATQAQTIRARQEKILLADQALSVEQFARTSKIMAMYYLNTEDINRLVNEVRYQGDILPHIPAPKNYIKMLVKNAGFMHRDHDSDWDDVRENYRHYADSDAVQPMHSPQ